MNSIAGLLLANKLAAGVAVAVLATGATVGTFAAQDKLPGQSHEPSPHATASPAANTSEQPAASITPRAVKGIPTGNPQHPLPTGTCENGEAAIKTVASGVAVTVPCQAIQQGGNGQNTRVPAAAATAQSGRADRTPGPGNATAEGAQGGGRAPVTPGPAR
jgi:hypothetical protein